MLRFTCSMRSVIDMLLLLFVYFMYVLFYMICCIRLVSHAFGVFCLVFMNELEFLNDVKTHVVNKLFSNLLINTSYMFLDDSTVSYVFFSDIIHTFANNIKPCTMGQFINMFWCVLTYDVLNMCMCFMYFAMLCIPIVFHILAMFLKLVHLNGLDMRWYVTSNEVWKILPKTLINVSTNMSIVAASHHLFHMGIKHACT